jgi:hypothetical protein
MEDAMLNRRHFMGLAGATGLAGWLPTLAVESGKDPARKRNCILLWMSGGPTQTDTFDPKPRHANCGPFKAVDTAVPGIQIAEHLPEIAKQMKHLAVVRSMSTREGDHGRAMQHVRSGYLPQGAIEFPAIGALIAKEREQAEAELPSYVCVTPRGMTPASLSSGYLGPRFAPLIVGGRPADNLFYTGGEGNLRVENLERPANVGRDQAAERLELLNDMQSDFIAKHPGTGTGSHKNTYERAARLMRESAAKSFDLEQEKPKLRDLYGRNQFGQGCLLARRLVERSVPFVEVVLGGWDTHDNNFEQVKKLCKTLDTAWSALMTDLKDRGLLDSTLVVWMGEFGRTPVINPRQGRDHFPGAWSIVLGGGGIAGGQVYGKTGIDGMAVEDKPVSVPDLLSTICHAIGVDPTKQNMSNVNRPIRIVDVPGKPLKEVLA